ncbi:MAG: glucose-6-phosphate isomerase family protein [Candidatus Cyclobacteriaceae bacterium M3_2C_046]
MKMTFNPGFEIRPTTLPLGFEYGTQVFGPEVEIRYLDNIRASLLDPQASGPEKVYAIAMDVGKRTHLEELKKRMLLFGVVTYASGQLGQEPIRSQGHIHRKSSHSGWSPPEIYEIWQGQAVIYMQERADDDPGHCYAVYAQSGDLVMVPPEWAHATISADPGQPLTFGAWCDREYGFEYEKVRQHQGLAWYPLLSDGKLDWQPNPNYKRSELQIKSPRDYQEFGLRPQKPIYQQFENQPEVFQFVSQPALKKDLWKNFVP